MMRQHAQAVNGCDKAKREEPFAVVLKAEAIHAVDDPNLGRRAWPSCLAFRLAASAMESIRLKGSPGAVSGALAQTEGLGGYIAREKTGSEIFSC